VPSIIFRKGLELRDAVAGTLNADYHSALVERVKAGDYTHREGRLILHLAREFGFCYGVDRAVDYAYQTRHRFPDRPIHLAGEIIHNPHVNGKLRALGIEFLGGGPDAIQRLGPDDVVILPAFGVTVDALARFEATGCTSSTRPAGLCSPGRPSGDTRRTISPPSSTERCGTRKPARRRPRRSGFRAAAT
jgi:4-hydroxy-3-methylbut-2-enyl diphosphate reductase